MSKTERGMSTAESVEHSDSVRPRHRSLFFFCALIFLIAAGTALEYARSATFQNLLINFLQAQTSMLRVTLIACFGGSLISIPLLRRRNQKRRVPNTTLITSAAGRVVRVHPLMMTSRPSRDSSFVIRKTKNRGRISRNRAGERLPATHLEVD